MKQENSLRNTVLAHAKEQYQTAPEYLWASSPNSAVLRHSDNRKWYALIMDVPKNKLGLSGDELVDILNVKCDPTLSISLRAQQNGVLPAYHMHKGNWISVLLDGTVDTELIFSLLDMSFELTAR